VGRPTRKKRGPKREGYSNPEPIIVLKGKSQKGTKGSQEEKRKMEKQNLACQKAPPIGNGKQEKNFAPGVGRKRGWETEKNQKKLLVLGGVINTKTRWKVKVN